ncbi:TPA: DUF2534 family protein [Klebsiella aerogenes]|nr:DUF2534 family protein [Klebsiella aerogenes]
MVFCCDAGRSNASDSTVFTVLFAIPLGFLFLGSDRQD